MRLCAICKQPVPPTAERYCSNECRYLGQRIRQAVRKETEHLGPVTVNTPSDLYRLRRANLRHLLDLKRAGHSPTRTELRIKRRAS